jgi:DNA-binding response OmpR family regulator
MGSAVTLLIVEDEVLVTFVIEEALRDGGYEVLTATTADEAMTILDDRSADIAALVTDIRLGSEKDGWDVARRARALNPAIPVIYTTGDSAADWPIHGVPKSVLLHKPFVAAQLVAAVSQRVNEATSALFQHGEGGRA